MARCPDVRGVTQSINDRDTSAVMGFRSRVLAGRDEIWDELGGLKVCLTARSFYQINTVQAEKLYQRAIELAQLTPRDRVLDAYCGVGLIGMLAARRAGQVRGVELVRDAVACARTAARVNRISNIDFICADAVNALRDDDFVPTVVFVDPPRAGCDARFLRSLSQAAPSVSSMFPAAPKRCAATWISCEKPAMPCNPPSPSISFPIPRIPRRWYC